MTDKGVVGLENPFGCLFETFLEFIEFDFELEILLFAFGLFAVIGANDVEIFFLDFVDEDLETWSAQSKPKITFSKYLLTIFSISSF